MAKTLFDKIWDAHVVAELGESTALIAVDRVFLHERTGASALRSMAEKGRPVVDAARVFAVTDHIVDTRPGRPSLSSMPGGEAFILDTRAAANAAGITLIDVDSPDQGITHVISPELGIVLPGCTLVAPDSHTCTQGAFGAFAWGIGSSEAEHAMATGTLRMARPKTMRVRFDGALQPGVTAKDLMLALLSEHGAGGGSGYALEFAGPAVEEMDMEARQTLCNMATEFAAVTALIAPDAKTFAALAGRRYAPASFDHPHWATLRSDADAAFDAEIAIDASAVRPMVSWGTSPGHSASIDGRVPADAPSRALDYTGLAPGDAIEGQPITGAYIGSCTNGRLTDLRAAADVLRGRHVAPGVTALAVPGSQAVKRAAEAEGLDRVFTDAGFEWRESGCGLCFYAGGPTFPPGARVVSSTNRNFEGRQGPGVRTHIASPATVAASAIAGRIAAAA